MVVGEKLRPAKEKKNREASSEATKPENSQSYQFHFYC